MEELHLMKKKITKDLHTEEKNLDGSTHPASTEPSKFLQACLLHSIIITSSELLACSLPSAVHP